MSVSSVPDPELIQRVAGALRADESLIEKDWYVVHALAAIATVKHAGIQPIFSGGTSLSKGWGLIKRFSEDIDFKVAGPTNTQGRKQRSAYRDAVLEALQQQGFILDGDLIKGDESRFFSGAFRYEAQFPIDVALRRRLKLEMRFCDPALPPTQRPLQSFLSQAERGNPEIAEFPCIDPAETAADKLSALSWRAHARNRAAEGDDPAIVRHLHDLAPLEQLAMQTTEFKRITMDAIREDLRRAKDVGVTEVDLLRNMPIVIDSDKEWRREYNDLVDAVYYGPAPERIGFDAALDAGRRLVVHVLRPD